MFHRCWMHYGLWFQAAQGQMEPDRFAQAERQVVRDSFTLNIKHLGKVFGFGVDARSLPLAAKAMGQAELTQAVKTLAVNWYVSDGVWFQGIKIFYNMDMAKSEPTTRSGAGLRPAVQGLKSAPPVSAHLGSAQRLCLQLGRVERFDRQGNLLPGAEGPIFRRGLPDYPCKSAGQVKHLFFARSLDPHIQLECLGCPPDEHPPEWFCAWRLTLGD